MSDDRLIKTVVFGIMDGTSRRGRPASEWLDDIQDVEVMHTWHMPHTNVGTKPVGLATDDLPCMWHQQALRRWIARQRRSNVLLSQWKSYIS